MICTTLPSGSRKLANRPYPSTSPTCSSNSAPLASRAAREASRSSTRNTAVAPPVSTARPSTAPWSDRRAGPASNSAHPHPRGGGGGAPPPRLGHGDPGVLDLALAGLAPELEDALQGPGQAVGLEQI